MAFFLKNTPKGIVVSDKKTSTRVIKMNGKERTITTQAPNMVFGFFGCENPEELGLKRGDEVPVTIRMDAPKKDRDGVIIPNLYWAD